MTETRAAPSAGRGNSATLTAEQHRAANFSAIAKVQPALTADRLPLPLDVEWLFARDRSLTAMLPGEKWWGGCSVPWRSAEFMFRNIDVTGTTACFLSPAHAAQIRVALDKLERRQGIVAIVPDPATLAIVLRCDDFSADISARRLWFAVGSKWQQELEILLDRNPGLPTPTQFIRPIASDLDVAARLIGPAQKIFSAVTDRRTATIQTLVADCKPRETRKHRLCVIAPSEFRLWNDAGGIFGELEFESPGLQGCRLDSDRPDSASPLALASLAANADAILAPNLFRGDLPGIVSSKIAWLTWVTSPRIAPPQAAGEYDRVLVADPAWRSLARHAGWNPAHIHDASWPPINPAAKFGPAKGPLTIIADTRGLQIPQQVADYSSHVLLWEFVRDELTADPFALGNDVDQYLAARRSRFQIAQTGLDSLSLVDHLIVPAFQQGVARLLKREGLAARIFGKGWEYSEELAAIHEGPVRSRAHLREILADAPPLVHLWPGREAHSIDAAGCPVVRAFGKRRETFLKDVRCIRSGALPVPVLKPCQGLTSRLIAEVLSRP